MKRIYLAARYALHPVMRQYRDELHALGFTVTSRWIDSAMQVPESISHHQVNTCHAALYPLAEIDLEDIRSCDVMIQFTEGEVLHLSNPSRGGRHIEYGYAYALNKLIIICGPRESIFHCLPRVTQFESWREVRAYLTARYMPSLPFTDPGKGKYLDPSRPYEASASSKPNFVPAHPFDNVFIDVNSFAAVQEDIDNDERAIDTSDRY